MVALLTTTLVLLIPVGAWALAATAVATEYAERRARVDVRAMQPTIRRVAPYFAMTCLSIPIGLLIWYLVAGVESEFGPLAGAADRLVTSLAVSFALTAAITLAAQASIARARLGELVGPGRNRVVPLIAAPSTGVLFAYVLSFLMFGSLHSILDGSFAPPPGAVDSVALALLTFGIANFGYLGGAFASNRISNLVNPQAYGRAMARVVIGEIPVVLGLVYAFLQLSALHP